MLTTNLGDLTEDVLLRILALCDINSVLSMSLVKYSLSLPHRLSESSDL